MLSGFSGCSSRAESPRQPPGASPHSQPSQAPSPARGTCQHFPWLWVAESSPAGTVCAPPAEPHLPLQPHLTPIRKFLRFAWVSCEIQSILQYQKGSELSERKRVHSPHGKQGFCSLCTKAEEEMCQFKDFFGLEGLIKMIWSSLSALTGGLSCLSGPHPVWV